MRGHREDPAVPTITASGARNRVRTTDQSASRPPSRLPSVMPTPNIAITTRPGLGEAGDLGEGRRDVAVDREQPAEPDRAVSTVSHSCGRRRPRSSWRGLAPYGPPRGTSSSWPPGSGRRSRRRRVGARQPSLWPSTVESGTPTRFATVRPAISSRRPGPAVRRTAGRQHRADAEYAPCGKPEGNRARPPRRTGATSRYRGSRRDRDHQGEQQPLTRQPGTEDREVGAPTTTPSAYTVIT